jgi:hypothetical protein
MKDVIPRTAAEQIRPLQEKLWRTRVAMEKAYSDFVNILEELETEVYQHGILLGCTPEDPTVHNGALFTK